MNTPTIPIYRYEFAIPESALDGNGHVNNVQYVQWMQEAAIRHYSSIGGIPPLEAMNATWVVRSHKIEYLLQAYAGERIEVRTWIAGLQRVRVLRRYEFVRLSDKRIIVKGETEWVFVDIKTGMPLRMPEEVVRLYTVVEE